MGRVWAKIRIGQRTIFLNAQKRMPFCYASTFSHFSSILLHVGAFGEQLEFFLCFSFHIFGDWLHFSHGWEVVFVVLGIGLFSSRFGSCWCIFHSRFFVVSCVFTMAVKGHSRFLLSHCLLVSRTDYLGRFYLLWVVLTNKLQDCVFSPHCEPFCSYVWGLL